MPAALPISGGRAVHFGSGVRPRGEVLAPVDERLVAKVRAAIDAAWHA
ncbi:copper homeostasis protein CutC [Paraburkholderia sp. Se-20369]|nr:copper homeostasis protein CutC [Paraburkholderia sp. Se-20369]